MNAERMPLPPDANGPEGMGAARYLFDHVRRDCPALQALQAQGYAHLPPAVLTARLPDPAALESFRASWEHLPVDGYMNDGGRYRRRRHAVLAAAGGRVWLLPHRPHFQSRVYNTLNGGIARHYAQVEPQVLDEPVFRVCLNATLDSLPPDGGPCWFVEVHQFRILARAGEEGRPTPEGVHRDGVERVFMALIGRDNVAGGISRIHAPDHTLLHELCLREPLEALLVDDAAVRHGVTPIDPLDPARKGVRDMLVITARRATGFPDDYAQP